MEGKPQAPMTGRLPRTVRIVRILIGIQLFRLIGLAFITGLQNGTLPATFVIPASTGDALTAVTAPIVAFAMGRGGIRTWAVALVWNALGLADLLNAVSLGSLTGSTAIITANYSFVFVGVVAAVAFHFAAIALLVRKTTMDYFWAQ
jgi:hypothetical protein